MIPEDCPYTVRVVSEVLESNGSSSMATVCAGTMALMDAGVQIKRPVSGIAMGLISDGQRYAVLSDILGDEDPNDLIGAFIGPGGKHIQELQKETETTIVITEDPVTEEGIIEILGTKPEGIETVISRIESMMFKPEKGSVYEVKVIKILDFGAVVEYTEAPGNEVLLHVSELAWERTNNVTDVVKMGDILDVKYFGLDPRTRKEKVSRKAIRRVKSCFLTIYNRQKSFFWRFFCFHTTDILYFSFFVKQYENTTSNISIFRLKSRR